MDRTTIEIIVAQARSRDLLHEPVEKITSSLSAVWRPQTHQQVEVNYLPDFSRRRDIESARRPPPWYLGLSNSFKNSVRNIDRKLQGRILDALMEIADDPITPRGDTVRALAGPLAGCWRYRIGDFRLVYEPDRESGNITVLSFASRGSVYLE